MVNNKLADYAWMDGKIVEFDDAKVHVLTHALHYGSAVFEGIHSYKTDKGTAVFRLDEHIERLFFSANSMSMELGFDKSEIKIAILQLLKKNNHDEAYIRPLAYYGFGNVGVFPKDIKARVLIVSVPWGNYHSRNLRVMTSSFIRNPPRSTVFGAKISGNYSNSILAMFEARKKGFDEALMLDEDGFVSEGPVQNFFVVKNNELVTPDSRSALLGITRDSIITVARDIGIKVAEREIKLEEAKNADELFFCGTATEITPIISIDDKIIGNGEAGKLTAELRDKFYEIARGKDKRYSKWLSYVN